MPTGVLFTLIAYVIWGLFPFYFRAINSVGALEILAHRVIWSLLLLVLILFFQRRWKWVRSTLTVRTLLIFTASATLIAANWGVYVYAIVNDQTLEASLGYFINPLMSIALGAVVLKETLNTAQKTAVCLAAMGVVWTSFAVGSAPWLGLTLAATFAFYGLIRKMAPLASLEGLSLETFILFPVALGYLFVLNASGECSFTNPQTDSMTQILLICAGPITTIPLLFFAAGVRKIAYSTVGIIQCVSPTIVFLLGLFCFHEPFSLNQLIGFIFIWCAVALFCIDSVHPLCRHEPKAKLSDNA